MGNRSGERHYRVVWRADDDALALVLEEYQSGAHPSLRAARDAARAALLLFGDGVRPAVVNVDGAFVKASRRGRKRHGVAV